MLQIVSPMTRDLHVSGAGVPSSKTTNTLGQDMLKLIKELPSGISDSNKALYQAILRLLLDSYPDPLQNAPNVSDIKTIARIIIEDTLTDLYKLLTWNDGWNGYDARAPQYEAVTYAANWIVQLFLEVMELDRSWIEPNVTASAEGEVVFGWRLGTKRLTMYVGDHSTEYMKVWGPDVNDNMDDGNADITTIRKSLWEWLIS